MTDSKRAQASGAGLKDLKGTVRRQRDRLRHAREVAAELPELRRRVVALEAEVQENRALNRRIAELTDVVQELLLPADQRDEDALRARLADYDAGE